MMGSTGYFGDIRDVVFVLMVLLIDYQIWKLLYSTSYELTVCFGKIRQIMVQQDTLAVRYIIAGHVYCP